MRRAIIIAASAIVLLTGGVVEYRRLYPPVPLLLTLKDGLVSYWTMENPASQGEPDRCGSNDLTVQGTIGSVPGKIGNARSQRGLGTMVNVLQVAANPSMQFPGTSPFTWTAWIRPVGINLGSQIRYGVLGRNGGTTFEYGIEIALERFRFHILGATTAAQVVTAPTPVTLGAWFFVIGWRSTGGPIHIRVNNGTTTTTNSSTEPMTLAGAAFRMFNQGGSSAMTTDFDGDIDEVGLWSRVLTDDEQGALWNSGNGLPYSNFDCHGTPPPPTKHGGIIGGGVF